ncbi:glycoside hydrolase family 3 N-terminal domain-containing protein [Arthrobacter sp. JSM 101049]|uniref:glycoside hydrolase family 3 N-terminal domain-containing protein n=1 Tax=Arthrobacter sp. JSM 101049 TaxID=929097 RepID=UPI0035663BEF
MRAMVPVVSRRFGRPAASGALALALVARFSPVALTPAQQLARLTLYQRIGKVLMMGVPATGANATTLNTLTRFHVGNVFLSRRNGGTAATHAVVARVNATVGQQSTGGLPRFIATDQEGGYVQVLNGPGFTDMPTALHQGTWSTAYLQAQAAKWARQLRSAGVNVNLAPVGDTVPSAAFAPYNSPIGYWHREFGYTSEHVAADVDAFTRGMKAGGVAPVVKHFPGLGRVTKNTDTSGNVKDTITTRYSAYRRPFARAANHGTRWIMVSNAYYTRIDLRHIGTFSPVIMKTMLRHDLAFKGIVISDDLCNARQLSPWSYATRAKTFFTAGGTMLLCVNPAACCASTRRPCPRCTGPCWPKRSAAPPSGPPSTPRPWRYSTRRPATRRALSP